MNWRSGLHGLPTPLVVVNAGGHAQYSDFGPGSSEVAVGFLVFLHLIVHNLPELHM